MGYVRLAGTRFCPTVVEKAKDGFFDGLTKRGKVSGHGVAPSYAEVTITQTIWLQGAPDARKRHAPLDFQLRKRADDAADGVPCEQIRGKCLWRWGFSAISEFFRGSGLNSPLKKPWTAFATDWWKE